MPSDFTFRLSTYLTLAMACICLAVSEWDLLPEVTVVTGLVVVLLGLPFKLKGAYELSLRSANRVGLGIGIVTIAWIAYQFVNKNSLIYMLPWPASLLPYVGPVLLVLMLAKMFRPKHVGDWWAMQGIALAAVGMATAMADTPWFGVALGFYTLAAVWSVTAFYFRRTAGALTPVPNTDPGPTPEIVTDLDADVRSFTAFRRAVGWVILACVVVLPIFFLTPRSGVARWTFGTTAISGLGNEQLVDLNQTGKIQSSPALAFQVRVTDAAGQPFESISLGQRWRAVSFNRYDRGRWTRTDAGLSISKRVRMPVSPPIRLDPMDMPDAVPPPVTEYVPPRLGPNHLLFEFQQFTDVGGNGETVVFDPVTWTPDEPSPIWSIHRSGFRPWYQYSDASFRSGGLTAGRPARYRQVAVLPTDPDLSVGFVLYENPANHELNPLHAESPYQENGVTGLRRHADELLRQFVAQGKIPAAVLTRAEERTPFRLQVQKTDFELVARVFCEHLRTSPAYSYSLTLTRTDKTSDPIEDFVLRTKTGHCQRFASALALLLRAIGIPTAYVLGHRGCDYEGEGLYAIRQESAHAWCEVLIPRPQPPGSPHPELWHWLSLDPTPDLSGDSGGEQQTWWQDAGTKGVDFFVDFVVGLNAERQETVRESMVEWLAQYGGVVFALAVIAAVGVWLIRVRRRRRESQPTTTVRVSGVPWFDELHATLIHAGFPQNAGATPHEAAAAAAERLRARPETGTVAMIPLEITDVFYRMRFAGADPTESELSSVRTSLQALNAALRTMTAPTTNGGVA